MKRSPLHDTHTRLGARFIDFGGWEMPLQYDSVLTEHRSVRESVGFFDVTHLGRFELTGFGAHEAIRNLLCNDIDRIEPGRCQYTMMLNEDGGIIDDMIIWWWGEEQFWVMPNAANQDRVMARFASERGCDVSDLQSTTALIALQGPTSPDLFEDIVGDAPPRFATGSVTWNGGSLDMAGTGYTGERGGEICTDHDTARALLESLVDHDVTPCGLGARDTLRLEAGLTLWGQDIHETTTPLEAGLDFAVDLGHDFVGRDRLSRQAENGVERRLVGFVLDGRRVPRSGYRVRTGTGGAGRVTSGNISPMLDRGIGLAYVSPPPVEDESIEVEIRGRWVAGRIAEPPFHDISA